jgi:hypothetical protein
MCRCRRGDAFLIIAGQVGIGTENRRREVESECECNRIQFVGGKSEAASGCDFGARAGHERISAGGD